MRSRPAGAGTAPDRGAGPPRAADGSRNPLDRLPSLKLRLGLLIVLAIGVTLATMLAAGLLDVPLRVGAAAALVLSLATVQVLARGTTQPLKELRAAADRVAAREPGVRVAVRGRDEVAALGHAFNRMAAELDETERIRRDLVADAAHELRTPVAALAAVLENDLDGVEPADPAALLDQVRRLGTLADRLLDLSRLDSGATDLHVGTVAVRDLVDRPVDDLDVPDDLVIRGDAILLRQALANLLDNAARHGAGPVTVSARGTPDGGTLVAVEDRGPGLPPGDEERVFERFARLDRARTVPGAGLGLAIVRSIAELHGGAVRAEHAEPHGCRVVLTLPARPG